jgi:hypothetical protein
MEEVTLRQIYDWFASEIQRHPQGSAIGTFRAYARIYQALSGELLQEVISRARALITQNPSKAEEIKKEAMDLLMQYEQNFAPTPEEN